MNHIQTAHVAYSSGARSITALHIEDSSYLQLSAGPGQAHGQDMEGSKDRPCEHIGLELQGRQSSESFANGECGVLTQPLNCTEV